MLQFTYCGLSDVIVTSRLPLVYGDLTCHFIGIFVIQCFIRVFSALCLLNNLRGATLQARGLNIMCAQLFI